MGTMKAILWDMDGTLVDTEPRWGEATFAMTAEMGRELIPEVREQTVGGIAENTVRICAEWAGISVSEESTLHYWVNRLYDLVSELFAENLPFLPGVPGLLREGEGTLPMMVVTNTYRRLTEQALQTIGAHYFTSSVCGDEVPAGKPAPDPYLVACQRLGLQPDDCLVIEDSANGMCSAVKAGCRVLGVPAVGTPVPAGARSIEQLLPGHRTLDGLSVADLHDLWGHIGTQSTHVPQ